MKLKLFILVVWLIGGCGGCSELNYKNNYDFDIKLLPIPTSLTRFQEAEMRFEIQPIEGSYSGMQYFIRYFQYAGAGYLSNEKGVVFFPNDLYEIENKKFILYFQPIEGEQATLELVFTDSAGHEKIVNIAFEVKNIEN